MLNVEIAKIGTSAAASGTANDARIPVNEKSSGPRISSAVHPESTFDEPGGAFSQTTESSLGVRVTEKKPPPACGIGASGGSRQMDSPDFRIL